MGYEDKLLGLGTVEVFWACCQLHPAARGNFLRFVNDFMAFPAPLLFFAERESTITTQVKNKDSPLASRATCYRSYGTSVAGLVSLWAFLAFFHVDSCPLLILNYFKQRVSKGSAAVCAASEKKELKWGRVVSKQLARQLTQWTDGQRHKWWQRVLQPTTLSERQKTTCPKPQLDSAGNYARQHARYMTMNGILATFPMATATLWNVQPLQWAHNES